jgi:hypothetical protein
MCVCVGVCAETVRWAGLVSSEFQHMSKGLIIVSWLILNHVMSELAPPIKPAEEY